MERERRTKVPSCTTRLLRGLQFQQRQLPTRRREIRPSVISSEPHRSNLPSDSTHNSKHSEGPFSTPDLPPSLLDQSPWRKKAHLVPEIGSPKSTTTTDLSSVPTSRESESDVRRGRGGRARVEVQVQRRRRYVESREIVEESVGVESSLDVSIFSVGDVLVRWRDEEADRK